MTDAYSPARIGIMVGSSRGSFGKVGESLDRLDQPNYQPSLSASSTIASLSGVLGFTRFFGSDASLVERPLRQRVIVVEQTLPRDRAFTGMDADLAFDGERERGKIQKRVGAEGAYLPGGKWRTRDPAKLWQIWVQLTEAAAPSRTFTSEVNLRPIWNWMAKRGAKFSGWPGIYFAFTPKLMLIAPPRKFSIRT